MICIGMPEVYRGWKSKHNCSFHYLSAMPDQLYTVTKDFVDDQKFPDGTFHMRYDRLYLFYRHCFFRIVIFVGLQHQFIISFILWVSAVFIFLLCCFIYPL